VWPSLSRPVRRKSPLSLGMPAILPKRASSSYTHRCTGLPPSRDLETPLRLLFITLTLMEKSERVRIKLSYLMLITKQVIRVLIDLPIRSQKQVFSLILTCGERLFQIFDGGPLTFEFRDNPRGFACLFIPIDARIVASSSRKSKRSLTSH
jgi:hypothetical protein